MRKSPLVVLVAALLILSGMAVLLSAQEKAAAKAETVTGTLVDLKCYATAGVLTNDHGSAKGCGAACAANGLPVAVVDANKKVHVLGVSAADYASYVGQELRFTGTHGKHADILIPEKLEVKEDGKWVEKKLP